MAFDVPNNQEFTLSPREEHRVNLVAGHFSNRRWELCTIGMKLKLAERRQWKGVVGDSGVGGVSLYKLHN